MDDQKNQPKDSPKPYTTLDVLLLIRDLYDTALNKAVLWALALRSNPKRDGGRFISWASLNQLSDDTGFSRRAIARAMRDLIPYVWDVEAKETRQTGPSRAREINVPALVMVVMVAKSNSDQGAAELEQFDRWRIHGVYQWAKVWWPLMTDDERERWKTLVCRLKAAKAATDVYGLADESVTFMLGVRTRISSRAMAGGLVTQGH